MVNVDYEGFIIRLGSVGFDKFTEDGVTKILDMSIIKASSSGGSVSCEAHRPDICIWRNVENEYYDTTCKHSVYFDDGSLEDKPDYKYCPYCGKGIFNEGAPLQQSCQ